MKEDSLTIGRVARKVGINVQTLRYYERRQLLVPAARTDSGYRLYPQEAVRRVLFIKRAQALGFSLEEIKELLAVGSRTANVCGDVRDLVLCKVSAIEEKIRQLRTIRRALESLARECSGRGLRQECPILDRLEL